MEGDPYYTTHLSTYDYLWVLTNIKMYTSGIYHTSNGLYSTFMAMRAIYAYDKGEMNPKKHTIEILR